MNNANSIIENFKRGKLNIDCANMVLKSCKDNNEYFIGKGYIRQTEDEELEFKIYVNNHNAEPFSSLNRASEKVVGKLLQEEDFFNLEAIDISGIQWKIRRIFPSQSWNMTDTEVVVTGIIHSMEGCLNIAHESPYLRLHFFDEYEVPLTRMSKTESRGVKQYVLDHAEFEAHGAQFEINQWKNSGETIITVTSSKDLPESFDLRVQESLQYITAKPAFWRARVESRQQELYLRLLSNRKKSVGTQLHPPLHPARPEFLDYGWALFSSYLGYVTKNTAGTHWNPVAYHLYNACEATATSLESSAVGISVAVEAISNLVGLEKEHKNQEIADFQCRIRAWLKKQTDVSESTIQRVTGIIDAIAHKRPKDTLHALADEGKIQEKYIKSWTKIRNKHVHPNLKDLKIPTQADTQNLLDEINKIQVLLRQITFSLIGYEGYFTDYGTHGFPSTRYPLL